MLHQEENISPKIEKIKKYCSRKSFWSEIPDDRPHNKDDHLYFLLPIVKIIRPLQIEEKVKKDILFRLKTLWEFNAEELGPESTPQEIAISFMTFSFVRMYKIEEAGEDWIRAFDAIYDAYFTKERLDIYNKFEIIK